MLVHPKSPTATAARGLVEGWQARFAARLDALHATPRFAPVSWLRDGGLHGGGTRLAAADTPIFDRASINVSQVHYDDLPDKRLASATALSTIVHPQHPRAPSVHIHVSWTELRGAPGYWRLMADLNPSHPDWQQTKRFEAALKAVAPAQFAEARGRGDRYFAIPALDRHRGVTHFYLEAWRTADPDADRAFADAFACAALDIYADLLDAVVPGLGAPTDAERATQRAYHTLYFFQVLTLDRGTTSGLLVHDQNDVGIMGSLPSRIDVALLKRWRDAVPALQRPLVDALVAAAGDGRIDAGAKRALADAVRAHYRAHPEALDLQASGGILPPTVANHS